MNPGSQVFALLAALLHVLFFCMESLWFMRPNVHKRFGVATDADAQACGLFAFNQGFYNLFLAIGTIVGLALLYVSSNIVTGRTLVLFSCACMFGAAVVLALSGGRRMLRASLVQGVFPLLAWVVWLAF